MDLFKIFSLSGSGMAAQRSRMTVVAGNLANSETTRTPDGGPYRRRNIIFQSVPAAGEFSAELDRVGDGQNEVQGVEVVGVKQSSQPPRKLFDLADMINALTNDRGVVNYRKRKHITQ